MDLSKLMDPPGAAGVDASRRDYRPADRRWSESTTDSSQQSETLNHTKDCQLMTATARDSHHQRRTGLGSRAEAPPSTSTREETDDWAATGYTLTSKENSRDPMRIAAPSSARPANSGTPSSAHQHSRRSKMSRAQRSGMKKARSGPLIPIGKLKAHLMRKLRVCDACRRKKVSCDARHHDTTWHALIDEHGANGASQDVITEVLALDLDFTTPTLALANTTGGRKLKQAPSISEKTRRDSKLQGTSFQLVSPPTPSSNSLPAKTRKPLPGIPQRSLDTPSRGGRSRSTKVGITPAQDRLAREPASEQFPAYTPEFIALRFQGSNEDREAMDEWLLRKPHGVKLEILDK